MTFGMVFTLTEHQFPYLYNEVNDITYIISFCKFKMRIIIYLA